MSLFIHITRRARHSRVALALLVAVVLTLFANVPASRAIHAASRVQAAPPPAAAAERRMTVLLFDLTSMSAEDVSRATNAAGDFITTAGGDLVSVVTLDSRLRVASDFTSDAADLRAALANLRNDANNVTLTPQPAEVGDVRLRAVKMLCQTLAPLQQRKSLMYFSAGVAQSDSLDFDRAALNDATNTCRRANVLIYPVDTRGLAAVAGGTRGGGTGLFNGLPK